MDWNPEQYLKFKEYRNKRMAKSCLSLSGCSLQRAAHKRSIA